MMFVPIPIGSEPAPVYVPVSPWRAKRIRTRAFSVGLVLVLFSIIGGTLTVVLAFGLPGSWNNTVFGAVMAGISAAFLFISGFGIIGARIYVFGEWMNIAGTRVLRRVLLVVCIGTVAFAALAAATLAGMAGSGPAAVPILLLLVTAAGAVVGLAAMWRLLGPPRS